MQALFNLSYTHTLGPFREISYKMTHSMKFCNAHRCFNTVMSPLQPPDLANGFWTIVSKSFIEFFMKLGPQTRYR